MVNILRAPDYLNGEFFVTPPVVSSKRSFFLSCPASGAWNWYRLFPPWSMMLNTKLSFLYWRKHHRKVPKLISKFYVISKSDVQVESRGKSSVAFHSFGTSWSASRPSGTSTKYCFGRYGKPRHSRKAESLLFAHGWRNIHELSRQSYGTHLLTRLLLIYSLNLD